MRISDAILWADGVLTPTAAAWALTVYYTKPRDYALLRWLFCACGVGITVFLIVWDVTSALHTMFRLLVVGILFAVTGAFVSEGIRWTYRAANSEPKSIPSLIATWFYDDPGPYELTIFNSGKEPIFNAIVSISNAMLSHSNIATVKIGDINPGATPGLGLPKLSVGYYQIDFRYRGGFVTQMLSLAFKDHQLSQASWISDGQKVKIEPKKPALPLPIFSFTESAKDKTGKIAIDVVRISIPLGKDGIHLVGCETFVKNLTEKPLKIRLDALRVEADGQLIAETLYSGEYQIILGGGNYVLPATVPINRVLPVTTRNIILKIAANSETATLNESFKYDVQWEDGFPKLVKAEASK